MGEFRSGVWIVGLSIYFIVLIFGLSLLQTSLHSVGIDYSFTTSQDSSYLELLTTTDSICFDPRTYTTQDGETREFSPYQENSALCEWTSGSVSETICNSIAGCTWITNDTSFFFFTRDAYCDGIIDLTNYSSYTNQTTNYFKSLSSTHANDTIYIVRGHIPQYALSDGTITQDICTLAQTESNCAVLGCTWSDVDDKNQDVSLGSITRMTGSLFTFQATFTNSYWFNLILTLLLFYIPLLMFVVALYFAVPFLH